MELSTLANLERSWSVEEEVVGLEMGLGLGGEGEEDVVEGGWGRSPLRRSRI